MSSRRTIYQLKSLSNRTRMIFRRQIPPQFVPGSLDLPPIPRKRRKLFGGGR